MSRFAVLAAGVAAVAAVSLIAPGAATAATKKPVTITAVPKSMTYGGSEPALSYAVSGLAKGDALTRKPTCTVPAHRAAGRYTITCSGAAADANKYTIRYVAGAFTVGKALLTIAANYVQKAYADADPTGFTYTASGFVRGDRFVTAPRCAVAEPHVNVGRYPIECQGADAGPNYAIRYFAHFYVITKSALLVGPYAQYVFYGAPEPEFTHAVFGLKDGESLTSEPTCGVDGEHEHAGTYTIECTGAAASSNYDLNVVDNEYTVLQTASIVKGEHPVYRRDLLTRITGVDVEATLYAALGGAYDTVAGETVTFTSGDTTLCTAVTDSAGQARCTLGANAATVVAQGGYTVTYAGTDDIAGSHHDVDNA